MPKTIIVPYDIKSSIYNNFKTVKDFLKGPNCADFKINLSSLIANAVKGRLYEQVLEDDELKSIGLKKRGSDFLKTTISLKKELFDELENFSKNHDISKRILLEFCAKKVIDALRKNIDAINMAIVGANEKTKEVYISLRKLKKLQDRDLISAGCRKVLGQISETVEFNGEILVFGEKKEIIKNMLNCLKEYWSVHE